MRSTFTLKNGLMFLTLLLWSAFAMAQNKVSGRVTADDGVPMPGVIVSVKNSKNAASTDVDGNYSLNGVESSATLEFQFMGYKTKEVVYKGQATINVALESDAKGLGEVVVTALGIKRDKKALGYGVSTIKSDELVKAGNTVNPLLSLYGKASGVRIASTNNGPTGGMIINIRNTVSLSQTSNTRPLFVVDGIPIYDQNTGNNLNDRDGRDRGTGINDINAEDIESMEILKGAKAAVLYGYAGANGVVLITTKKGSKQPGLGIDFSSSYTFDNAAFQPKFQNIYGSGGNIAYENVDPALSDADGFKYEVVDGKKVPVFFKSSNEVSFGPKMDGRQVYWYDGVMRPYTPQPNNYGELFNEGHLRTNNFAVSNSGQFGSIRFAYSNKGYQSVYEGANQQNHVLSFSGNFNIGKAIKLNFNSNYYYTNNHNAPYRIQSFATYGVPRDMKTDLLRDNITNEDGYNYWAMNKGIANRATGTISGTFGTDYLWNQTQNTFDEIRNHFIQSVNLVGTINPWMNIAVTGGYDMTRANDIVEKKFTRPLYLDNKQGYYSENNLQHNSIYGQGLLNIDRNINQNFRISGSAGGVIRYNSDRNLYGKSENFAIENLFSFNNSTDVSPFTGYGDQGDDVTYSALASANLSYKDYLFLEVQGRNDWTSILPPSNNTYFYPGASLSWIPSQTFKLPETVKFAKVRVSLADVGRPGNRYFGNNSFDNGLYGSIPFATTNGSLPPVNVVDGKMELSLKPEKKREFEAGFDLKLFEHNRLGVEFSYFKSNSYNQIMALDVPRSSGVNNIRVNAGNIQTSGLELQLTGTPVLTKNFTWNNTLNISQIKNKVIALANGVTIQPLWGVQGAFARATVGREYGEIYINPWKRNDKGQLVVSATGLYQFDKDNVKKVGVIQPKIGGGYNSSFNYKNFKLDLDLDYQFGGTLISQSNMFGRGNGTFVESLKYRDEAHGGLPYYVDKSGGYHQLASHSMTAPTDSKYPFIFHDGVVLDGVTESGSTNTKLLSAEQYYVNTYWQGGMDVTEDVVYKSDYLALRRITFAYDLPKNITNKLRLQKAEIGVFVFNVGYLFKAIPNVTPESTGSTNEFFESTNLPGVRSMGCQLKVSF